MPEKNKLHLKLPVLCPSCQGSLTVSELICNRCGTGITGNYDIPVLLQLTQEEQDFVLQFFLSSGSLKQMAQQMSISYPTVRNRLDDLIDKIKNYNIHKK